MDTNCLGGRRNKQKPQQKQEILKQKQNYYYQPQQQTSQNHHFISPSTSSHHQQYLQNQEQNKYPLDFYQKSTILNKKEEIIENSIIKSSIHQNTRNCDQNNIKINNDNEFIQNNEFIHFPPPPDYPPPIMDSSSKIILKNKNLNENLLELIPITNKLISMEQPTSSSTTTTTLSSPSLLVTQSGTTSESNEISNKSDSNNSKISIINLKNSSNKKIENRKYILNQQQQEQHHYSDLDLNAIEVCNESVIIEPKPLSSSSIKALLRNKNTLSIKQYKSINTSPEICDNSNNIQLTQNQQFHNIDNIQQYHHHQQQQQQEQLQKIVIEENNISTLQHPIDIAVNPSGFGGIIHHPYHQQDYSYAYYEPGAAMRHSNIPQPEQIINNNKTNNNKNNNDNNNKSNHLSPPPPNSIRALLSKGKKNKLLVSQSTKQSYQLKFNNLHQHHQENFYEEISNEISSSSSGKLNCNMGNNAGNSGIIKSSLSPSSSSCIINTSNSLINNSIVEQEFRRVENHHRKVLGELNLSVEALLMPEPIIQNNIIDNNDKDDDDDNNRSNDINKFIINNNNKKFPSSNSIKTIIKSSTASTTSTSSIKSKNSIDNLVNLIDSTTSTTAQTTINDDLLIPNETNHHILLPSSSSSSSAIGTSGTILQPIINPSFCCDLDSGFSGSSGASYIGNLRYHKTNAALTNLMTSRKLIQNDNFINNDFNNHEQNQFNIKDHLVDDTTTLFHNSNNSCRSSQRSSSGICNLIDNNINNSDGNINLSNDNNSGFIIRSSHTGKKILNFSKLKLMEEQIQPTKTESNARSFWNRKGYKKSPSGSSSSTSNINQTVIDETKLNSGSWEDPLPITKSQTITTAAQLHNTSLRRLDPLHSRASYNCKNNLNTHHHQHINHYHYRQQQQQQFILPPTSIGHHQQQHNNNNNNIKIFNNKIAAALGGNNIIGRVGGGSGCSNISNNDTNNCGVDSIIITEIDNQLKSTTKKSLLHKRLEHTPSARTINSSEDSWCSEERDDEIDDIITSEDDDDNNSGESLSIISTIVTKPTLTTATQQQQQHQQQQQQQQQRNSQLRSTFNKAKQHLSFDKWRTSGSGGGSSNNNSTTSSSSSPNSQQSSPQFQQHHQQQKLSIGGNNSDPNLIQSITSATTTTTQTTMPIAAHPHPHLHHHHNQDTTTTTPGETPGGRLSRWFSIRRGSTHQYDVGGRDGRNSSSSSIDATDTVSIGSGCGGGGGGVGGGSCGNNTDNLISKALQLNSGNSKMPQLPENEDDTTHTTFDLDLMLPPGSRANGTARPHPRLITPMLPPAPPGLSQQQLKRRHIVAAIVHSENSYVATLQRLVNDYKKPLEDSSPPILSSSKISILFHRLPEILQSHKMFRIALADCVRNWDRDEKLGDVFVGAFSKPLVLEMYSGFINNFSAAMELAKMEAKRKSALADFFKVKQISAHDRLSFFGLMVKPVQRFPQFILFLQDLLKYTPQGHHDRINLQLALTQLESLAEMLNERKREAEQYQAFKEMLAHISGTFNTRSLASTDGNRNRYLLREDNVTQMEFNQAGFIIKSKQRRLLLLNDKVICVSVAPKQSHDFGATEKLSFKWMYPVTDVEIVDNSTSATLSRILTAGLNRGGSLKSNSSSCNNDSPATILTNGADNLCNEMSTLMYDYEVISRMNDLVGTLKGQYKEINTNITRNLMNTIQNLIQRKDEEMAWVDSCCLQLIARNKSGKEETFTFQTETPNVKKEWITELRLAQLALDQNNSPAWEIPELEQKQSTTKMPLFVKAQTVYKSQHQTEVRCGCYYSIQNDNKVGTARRRHKRQNYLWVCTSDGQSSHITVLSQHHQQAGNLKDVGSFDLVETQITSMEFIKGLDNSTNNNNNNNNNKIKNDEPQQNNLLGDLIWMGTDSRKILIYSATNPEQEEQLGYCSVPGIVTKILYHFDSIYVTLTNSTMLIYRRGLDGNWLLKEPQIIQLGNSGLIVTSILPINMNIYASCGNRVAVLNAITGEIQKSFEIQQHGTINQQVNLMAHSGIGLWISLKNSSIICLYHTETFKHLQDINIAANVLRVKTTSSTSLTTSNKDTCNNGSIHVTALLACKGLLWVGTNVGIALTIPLPRLEGVPIISGGVSISCHAHFGPITFLLPLVPKSYTSYKQIPQTSLSSTTTTTTNNIQSSNEQPALINEEDNENQQGGAQGLKIINNDKKKIVVVDDDDTTNNVILRKDIKENDDSIGSSEQDSPKTKLDKQNSLDLSFSAKLRAQLANSPALRRKRYREISEISRMSKTLPRGLGSTSINQNTINGMPHTDHGYCDVYGLYGKLIFVKEDYDNEEGGQGNLMDMMYECMRRSDPELAAIPGKVSTLDRRLRMKASRPRSLDLSNWSVDSKSSSLCTSSGSEESVGMRLFGGRSVSRNSSSASHKTSGNGSDLGNISENGIITTVDIHSNISSNLLDHQNGQYNKSNQLNTDNNKLIISSSNQLQSQQQQQPQSTMTSVATMKRNKKSNNKNGGGNNNGNNNNNNQNIDGPRTLLTLMGGRGYWRHVWYTNSPKNSSSPSNNSSSGTMSRVANSNDAHIVIWEKKL